MAGLWPQNGRDEVRLAGSQGTAKSPGLVPRPVFLSLCFAFLLPLFNSINSAASFLFRLFLRFSLSLSLPLSLLYSFVLFPPPLHAAAALWSGTIPSLSS